MDRAVPVDIFDVTAMDGRRRECAEQQEQDRRSGRDARRPFVEEGAYLEILISDCAIVFVRRDPAADSISSSTSTPNFDGSFPDSSDTVISGSIDEL
jgi:hypothetical protein